jgi:ubiquinone/menaquinone biosynthesis C-methylase UbiE/NAD-dependent dihydropyrimidine dehydrogenase PreA subunit
MAFVLMKIFEEAPRRFDRWMNILTLGRLQHVRDEIANTLVRPNASVLEIGCGTGSLLQMLSVRCARVTGIDSAPGMIEEAQQRLSEAGLSDKTEVKKLHALQIEDEYKPGTFDQIVSVLAFSEMSDDEIDCLLFQCRKALKPGGELILADESEPSGLFRRWTYRAYRFTSRLVTYLGLQANEIKKGNIFLKLLYFAIELPLMILAFFVAPPVTHPLHEIERRLEHAGFEIQKTQLYLGGALKLVCASVPASETVGHEVAPAVQSTDLRGEARAAGLEADGLWHFLKALPKIVILQYVFRSIPYPTPPRLIRIGNPGRKSPVLVTSNYALTVRRVCRSLKGTDCYLLVAPAGGIDVWCAAGGGKFTIDSIISILKTSRIAELVDHRRLVLPQLCANGINLFDVRRRTSWSAVFGPVDAADIPEYLKGRRRTEQMMRVTYTVRERLEMALAMWGSLSLRYTIFPVLIFGIAVAPWFALIVAVLAVIISLGCFVIPGKTFVQKAGVLFLSASVIVILVQLRGGGMTSFGWRSILLLLAAAYLVGSSYPSYTPLWQCGYSKLFYGFPNLRLEIIEESCIGCKLCDQVCPVECFAPTDHKMVFSEPDLCEGCMACLIQCPTDAIINQVADEHQRLSQCQ